MHHIEILEVDLWAPCASDWAHFRIWWSYRCILFSRCIRMDVLLFSIFTKNSAPSPCISEPPMHQNRPIFWYVGRISMNYRCATSNPHDNSYWSATTTPPPPLKLFHSTFIIFYRVFFNELLMQCVNTYSTQNICNGCSGWHWIQGGKSENVFPRLLELNGDSWWAEIFSNRFVYTLW